MRERLSRLGPGFQGTFRAEDMAGVPARDRSRFFTEERIDLDTTCRRCGDWNPGCGLVPEYQSLPGRIDADAVVPCHCNRAMLDGPVELPFAKLVRYNFERDRWVAQLRHINDLTEEPRELSPDLFFLGIAPNAPDTATSVFLSRLPLHDALHLLDGRFDGRRLFIGLRDDGQASDVRQQALLAPVELALTMDSTIRWKTIAPAYGEIGKIVAPRHAALVFTHEHPEGSKVSEEELVILRKRPFNMFVDGITHTARSVQTDQSISITPKPLGVLVKLMQVPNQEIIISFKEASDRSIRSALQAVDPQTGKGRTRRRWFHAVDDKEGVYRFSPGDDSYCLILPL